jgi:hypothetical protein
MAIVSGTLTDYGFNPLQGLMPRVVFTGSQAARSSTRLFSTRPIVVTPAANGAFSVNIATTVGLIPDTWYTVSIRWLDPNDPSGTGLDVLLGRIRVPIEGGNLGDLFDGGAPSGLIWIGITPPPEGFGYSWWIDTNGGTPTLKKNGA